MKRFSKKFVGAVLGLVVLFAVVGSASAQTFGARGYYDSFGYFHPYAYSYAPVRRFDRDDFYWRHRQWEAFRRFHREEFRHHDWDDHWRRR